MIGLMSPSAIDRGQWACSRRPDRRWWLEADALCDRVAILRGGSIADSGTPAELKSRAGPGATLDDVFELLTGAAVEHEGGFRDVRQTRLGAIEHS
jgi:hypothetical protein